MSRIVRALFENPEYLKSEDVSESEILKQLIKVHLPASIEKSIVGKKIYAPLFEINDSGQYIEVHKNNWVQALETCLVWYVEDEDYEMCDHIKNLIHSIQEKNLLSKKVSLTKNKTDGAGF